MTHATSHDVLVSIISWFLRSNKVYGGTVAKNDPRSKLKLADEDDLMLSDEDMDMSPVDDDDGIGEEDDDDIDLSPDEDGVEGTPGMAAEAKFRHRDHVGRIGQSYAKQIHLSRDYNFANLLRGIMRWRGVLGFRARRGTPKP